MHHLKIKLRYFFLPYMVGMLAVAVGYTVFYSVAVLWMQWLQPGSQALDAMYVIIAAMLPALWLMGRFAGLNERWWLSGVAGMMVCIVGMMWPVLGVHNYLTTAGNITADPNGKMHLLWNSDARWAISPFVICTAICLLIVLFAEIDMAFVTRMHKQTWRSRLKATIRELGDFVPRGDYFVAILLMNIFILVYVVSTFKQFLGLKGNINGYTLIGWGANYTPLTIMNQWWRLFTNIFLHDNPYHLALDVVMMFIASWYLERALGRVRIMVVFVVCGVAGSFCHMALSQAVGYGATGGILGVLGLCLALTLRGRVHFNDGSTVTRRSTIANILIGAATILCLGYFCGYPLAGPVGGFVSGILLGPAVNVTIDAEAWSDEDDW